MSKQKPDLFLCPTGNSCSSNTQFQCKDDRSCIDIALQCNGREDCGDGSDEDGCCEFEFYVKEVYGTVLLKDR